MAVQEPREITGNDCSSCENAIKHFKSINNEPNVFIIHLNIVEDLTGKIKTNINKERKLKAFEITLSALRNTKGGILLVHLSEKADEDKCLEKFDEFLDGTLKQLLCDGKTFTESYSRKWLCEHPEFPGAHDVLVITVAHVVGVSTVDFKTKITSDFQVEKPSSFNIVSLLDICSSDEVKPKIRGIKENLYENRQTQLKGFYPDEVHRDVQTTAESFAKFIWKDLRFREYLCSMSQLTEGGSFYLGVNERKQQYCTKSDVTKTYASKIPVTSGFELRVDQSDLQASLSKLLSSEVIKMTIRDQKDEWSDDVSDIIEIGFHKIEDEKVILEIAIGHVNGLLFYDKKGPEAYEIKENRCPVRISKEQWFRRIKRTLSHLSVVLSNVAGEGNSTDKYPKEA